MTAFEGSGVSQKMCTLHIFFNMVELRQLSLLLSVSPMDVQNTDSWALLVNMAQTLEKQLYLFQVFIEVLCGDDTAATACSSNCRENLLLEFPGVGYPVGNEEGWLRTTDLECSL